MGQAAGRNFAVGPDEQLQHSKQSASSSVLLAERIRKMPVESGANRKISNILKPLLEGNAEHFDETHDLQGVE